MTLNFIQKISHRANATQSTANELKNFLSLNHKYRLLKILFFNHFSLFQVLNSGIEIDEDAYIFCDGFLLASQLSSSELPIKRYSFDLTSIAAEWIKFAKEEGYFVLFFGGTAEESSNFSEWLKNSFGLSPNSYQCIEGFSTLSIQPFLDGLKNRNKKVFIVLGLGSPKQEILLMEIAKKNLHKFDKIIVTTCGGFITQTASAKNPQRKFYPDFIDKLGLRWLYRLLKQPFVLKRVIFVYPKMIFQVFRELNVREN